MGCGVNLSKLRPNGAIVGNSARTSTGPCSFMRIFDSYAVNIGSNNRRAALMIGLNCDHPDIEEFLKNKQNHTEIQAANTSILFTNKFMEEVKQNEQAELTFETKHEAIKKSISARDFFMNLAKANWDYAEPGCLFIDRIREQNLLSGYGSEYQIDIANPCFTGDMKLLTATGYRTFKELNEECLSGSRVSVISRDGTISDGKVWSNGVKEIVKVVYGNKKTKKEITCTPNHVFMLCDGSECQAKDLKGKRLMPFTNERAPIVSEVIVGEEEEVFDFSEPTNHWGVVNGVVVHNCGEFLGAANNACNLGSINLYNCVTAPFTDKANVNWQKLSYLVRLGVRALDDILDIGYKSQPLDVNREEITKWRAIGLGVFGLADMLIALGIKYGDYRAVELVNVIGRTIFENALIASSDLAKEKGTFRMYDWEKIKLSPMISRFKGTGVYDMIEKNGLRNGSLLSVAPTGSISTMCGVSGGVEPLFKISYDRTTHSQLNKTSFHVFAKSVEHLLKAKGLPLDTPVAEIQEKFPYVVSAHEIAPIERIKMQAALQYWIDNAISSTINLKNETTIEEVFDTYMEAWKLGCKGITVFRNGCSRTPILETKNKVQENEVSSITGNKEEKQRRRMTSVVEGHTYTQASACANPMYVTVNSKNGKVWEVFTNASGGCKSNISTITRLASLLLRVGESPEKVAEELMDNICPGCAELKKRGADVSLSCGHCIGEAILIEQASKNQEKTKIVLPDSGFLKCPECGEMSLKPEGRCFNCSNCGFSKCD